MREYILPVKVNGYTWESRMYDANEADIVIAALVECLKCSTEYRQGNPAFERAVARASAHVPEVRK